MRYLVAGFFLGLAVGFELCILTLVYPSIECGKKALAGWEKANSLIHVLKSRMVVEIQEPEKPKKEVVN